MPQTWSRTWNAALEPHDDEEVAAIATAKDLFPHDRYHVPDEAREHRWRPRYKRLRSGFIPYGEETARALLNRLGPRMCNQRPGAPCARSLFARPRFANKAEALVADWVDFIFEELVRLPGWERDMRTNSPFTKHLTRSPTCYCVDQLQWMLAIRDGDDHLDGRERGNMAWDLRAEDIPMPKPGRHLWLRLRMWLRQRAVVRYWQEAVIRTYYAPGGPGYEEALRAFVEDFGA